MYQGYMAEDELRWGYRLLFIVGVLSIISGVVIGSLSTSRAAAGASDILFIAAILSLTFGVAAIVAGILVRRRSRTGVLLGIIVGAVGLAFAAFGIVSVVAAGCPSRWPSRPSCASPSTSSSTSSS